MAISEQRIVDLTHPLKEGMPVYPGDPEFTREKIMKTDPDGLALSRLHLHSHLGTHVDAPAHIYAEGKTLDNYPLESFMGKGIYIDCRTLDSIGPATIEEAKIPAETRFILIYTGQDESWGSKKYFTGYPVLTSEAADYLTGLELSGLGADCPSFDVPGNTLTNHKILLRKGMLLIENLTRLSDLVGRKFEFYCIGLNYEDADGSPVRAFAKLTDSV